MNKIRETHGWRFIMTVREYLDRHQARYVWNTHPNTYTAQDLAQQLHESGWRVVKPVVVEADGEFVICAVPAHKKVDPERIKELLDATIVSLASELQLARVFDGCEVGAEPPIGEMFRIKTIMDDSLCDQTMLTFQAGTHHDAVTMSMGEYLKLAHPMVAHVTYGR
jgi:Ala-tRNA(Pro) deacylase